MKTLQKLTYLAFFAIVALLVACGGNNNNGQADQGSSGIPDAQLTASNTQGFVLKLHPAAQQPAGMPGIHSFAWAHFKDETDGHLKWLFVGGRDNGFHMSMGPYQTFPISRANNNIFVWCPATGQVNSIALPAGWGQSPQLRSTNMEHYQSGDTLIFNGGYGSSEDSGSSKLTFNTALFLNVPALGKAVIANDAAGVIASLYGMTENDSLMVTGGELEKIGKKYYLVFGQDYPRTYDFQSGNYTNSIVSLKLDNTVPQFTVDTVYTHEGKPATEYSPYHRRDLNVLPAMFGTSKGLIAYAGVFTQTDGAFVHPVKIQPDGNGGITHGIDSSFTQKANLYESATVLVYDTATQVMYTNMLGGISNYYYNDTLGVAAPSDTLKDALQLPFVRLINQIVMLPDGTMTEYIQTKEQGLMPGFLGSNAAFLPLEQFLYDDEILNMAAIKAAGTDSVMIGHMVGGINAKGAQSGGPNPTKVNEILYEVYLLPL